MADLSAQSIRANNIIYPFHERTLFESKSYKPMSFGLSCCSYDVRAEFDADGVREHVIVPPGGAVLVSTIEHFNMGNFFNGKVLDKSSWARRLLVVQNTLIEPGWRGFLTVELTNHSRKYITLERGVPIAQIVFTLLDKPTEQPYSGKYQDQGRGPQAAR
tara:strand:+ start:2718 stop:3197 length:480 start_codon:yes stop_codon:yes gene_type:complete